MESIQWTVELRFIVALAIGLLVGLERESSKSKPKKVVLGGIRTYPIISMFGFGCAWLHKLGVQAILPMGLISISILTAVSYYTKIQNERYGVTSEISALLTFIVGALAMLVDVWAAMALGIVNTMLLSEKAMMEDYVEKLDRVEFLAVLKFLLVTVIVLPVLPNKDYTQFNLNPTKIWQIVILVSTIGFVGYYLSKKFGDKVGFWLSGFVGGFVSSTAVTVAYGRVAQKKNSVAHHALQGAIVASSVMYVRTLIFIFVINPKYIYTTWWWYILLTLAGFGLSLISFGPIPKNSKDKEPSTLQNPFEIRPSVLFALLFVVLTVVTGFVKDSFGQSGIITLSALVGVTDITPFILSLVNSAQANFSIITAAIIISMMSNTIIKGVYFGYLVPSQRKDTAIRFGILTALHIPFIIASLTF